MTTISAESAVPARTLGLLLPELAVWYSTRPALAFREGEWTYSELAHRVREFAGTLLSWGFGKGDRVAILATNSPEFVVAAFGAATAGCVVVPLNTAATADEHLYVLRHSDASLLLVQTEAGVHRYLAELVVRVPSLAALHSGEIPRVAQMPYLRRIAALDPDSGVAGNGETRDDGPGLAPVADDVITAASSELNASDDAVIIYTSGTTAHPKAVLHGHESATVAMLRWADHMELSPDDRLWSSFPYFWTAGLAMTLGGVLASGACVVLHSGSDPVEILRALDRQRVTVVHNFDHMDARLARHFAASGATLHTVRRIRSTSPLRQAINRSVGDFEVGVAYGTSETFTLASGLPRRLAASAPDGSNGPPVPGMEIRIVEPGTSREVTPGMPGEVAVRGRNLMRGYYKATARECFDPDGWFHTGDGGFLDGHGHLHWKGRLSALIKTAGANVSPLEVELAVRRLGHFRTPAVVGVSHPTLGEAVVLCVVQDRRPELSLEEINGELRGALAAYKLPRALVWLTPDGLKLTGTDKLQLNALRELAESKLCSGGADEEWATHLRTRVGGQILDNVGR